MKILTLREQHDIDIGEYGPACEGFIDTFKKLFIKKTPDQERVEMIKNDRYKLHTILVNDLDKDLKRTYSNHDWVVKNLSETSGTVTLPSLKYANANGKPITRPSDIVHVARGMLDTIKATVQREKPFIELRQKLTKQAELIKSNEDLDKFWETHEAQLKVSPVDRARQQYKIPIAAFGCDNRNSSWPFDFKNPNSRYFTEFPSFETNGEFMGVDVHNAEEFAIAIRELMDIATDATEIIQQCRIPDWESLDDEIDYDKLKHGDEIFSRLFSSDGSREVLDMVAYLPYVLGPIICGLYIAMFDKKLVVREPATEGLLDVFRGKKTTAKDEALYKFDSKRAYDRALSFLNKPDSFQLTGKSFDRDAGLILSIKGHYPNPTEIAPLLTKTWKEANVLTERLVKNAIALDKVVTPLIEQFEKTVIAAMDREGNVPQEVLDRAMAPLVAAKAKVKELNTWNSLAKEANKYDGWLGGNPIHMEVKSFRGQEYLSMDYSAPPPVSVPRARDAQQLQDILKAAFEYVEDNPYLTLKGSLNVDVLEDVNTVYEFDRPVRHLWDEMNEEQQSAINTIYALEDTPGSMQSSIAHRQWNVFISILKYVDQSIASL